MPVASRPSGTWPRERWAWVSMALGAGILWFSCQWLYFGLVSRWWTTTTGTGTYSSAHESRRYRSVDIRYKYAVDGLEYEGDRFRYGYTTALGRLTSIEVSAAQAAYPVGSHPRVYVDPRHPARSVLVIYTVKRLVVAFDDTDLVSILVEEHFAALVRKRPDRLSLSRTVLLWLWHQHSRERPSKEVQIFGTEQDHSDLRNCRRGNYRRNRSELRDPAALCISGLQPDSSESTYSC
jgi:hypothetical protein